MIIWKGYGFSILFMALTTGGIASFIFQKIGLTEDLGAAISLIISALIIWFTGKTFNSPTEDRIMIDEQTKKRIIVKPDHSLFFIKVQYWAFFFGGLGVVMLVENLLKLF